MRPLGCQPGQLWGWQLMTPAERIEHQTNKMRSFKTYNECKAYQEEERQHRQTD